MRRSYVFGKEISLLVISSMLIAPVAWRLEIGSKPGPSNCFRLTRESLTTKPTSPRRGNGCPVLRVELNKWQSR